MVEDIGAPLTVTAVDLITETAAPDWNEWIAYVMAGGSYLAGWMGWGGGFIKNVGIASLPWAAKKLYERVRGGAGSRASRFVRRSAVSRYPAPTMETEFAGARLV